MCTAHPATAVELLTFAAPAVKRLSRTVRRDVATPAPTTLVLESQQALRVMSQNGQMLLTIAWDEVGPVIQLGSDDVALDVAGSLSIAADSIDLTARAGDVVVRGEYIRLN
ncbi:MAG TPA: hypothetical protein VL096_13190 [Pirellulaceae bacterium]|nr:hypothetical protein [Pirellulaceae bacterium]